MLIFCHTPNVTGTRPSLLPPILRIWDTRRPPRSAASLYQRLTSLDTIKEPAEALRMAGADHDPIVTPQALGRLLVHQLRDEERNRLSALEAV
jgi:hypothetical protein